MLTEDVTLSEAWDVNDAVTLDLAGHTLTLSSAIHVNAGGALIVKDSSATTSPTVDETYNVTYTSGKILRNAKSDGIQVLGGTVTVLQGLHGLVGEGRPDQGHIGHETVASQ